MNDSSPNSEPVRVDLTLAIDSSGRSAARGLTSPKSPNADALVEHLGDLVKRSLTDAAVELAAKIRALHGSGAAC